MPRIVARQEPVPDAIAHAPRMPHPVRPKRMRAVTRTTAALAAAAAMVLAAQPASAEPTDFHRVETAAAPVATVAPPLTAANATAVEYANLFVRYWGIGSHFVVRARSNVAIDKEMFAFAAPGGGHWKHTSTRAIPAMGSFAPTTNVTYTDEVTGVAMVVRVDNAIAARGSRHAVVTVRYSQPHAADAVQYADRFVKAWGRGDGAIVQLMAQRDVAREFQRWDKWADAHWVRTGSEGAAGTVYVTYTNDRFQRTLTVGVNNTVNLTGEEHAVMEARMTSG